MTSVSPLASTVQIVDFAGHRHLGALLVGWHVEEFGPLYDPTVWNADVARREFDEMKEFDATAGGTLPATWLAFAGDGRDERDLLGSVSLLASDDLAGFDHLTPWLASLFVAPSARGRGVGSLLVGHLLDAAAAAGFEHVHLFTADHERYYLDRGWRTIDHGAAAGRRVAVMVRSTSPRAARRAVCSRWSTDPDIAGAYSYVRAGATPDARDVLAEPVLDGLWFAGEATWREHPGTMHGAWLSGERAADRVAQLAGEPSSALIVGAGLSGLAAARRLREHGTAVVIVDAGDHIGGRATTDERLGIPLPLGGAWLHGDVGHPLAALVSSVADDWSDERTHLADHGAVTGADLRDARTARARVESALAAAGEHESVSDVVDRVLDGLALSPVALATTRGWIRGEYESLYAAPLVDVSARYGAEPYELPGGNRMITSSMGPVFDDLARDLDVRLGHRVRELRRADGRWTTDTGVSADVAIVTVPIGALRDGRIEFDPPLPARVRAAIDALGAGPVAKLFVTYDQRWWPAGRAVRLVGDAPFVVVVDVTDLTGAPVLCWFAVGEDARRIELMSEDEQCRLVDETAVRLRLGADGTSSAVTATDEGPDGAHTIASSSRRHVPVRDVALVGLAAGFLSGVFGVGGGLLIVPALVLVLHFDQRVANATSLAAILPIAVASLVTYWAAGNVDWPVALVLSLGALAGAVIGTKLLHVVPVRVISVVFVALMLATAVRLFIATDADGRQALDVVDATALLLVGLLSGTLAGLLGVGGGIVLVPAMVVLFGIDPVVAKGTSVAVIIPTSLMGTWRNRKHHIADIRVAAILGTCGIVSAVAGGLVADQMSDDLSNVLFAALLVVVSARQLWALRRPPAPSVAVGIPSP